MQIVNEIHQIDRALADGKPSDLLGNADTFLTLIKGKNVFRTKDGAFIAQRDENTGGKVFRVPVMLYCKEKGKAGGKEMSDNEVAEFVRMGGIVI